MNENPVPPAPPAAARGSFKWLKRALLAFALLSVMALAFMGHIGLLSSNFHEVAAGQCYRSAQMKPNAILSAIETQHIKTVLNLRGAQKNAGWYKDEVAACQAAQIEHIDINVGLGALPKPEVLQTLVEKLETAPQPILMHCRSGSDRTGLAAAFYAHLVEKKPLEEAEAQQVTWHFGHFAIGKAKCINDFFALYHATSNGQSLKEWLIKTYPSEYEKNMAGHTKSRVDD